MICGKCGQEHEAALGGRPCKGHRKSHLVDGERIFFPENERPPCRKNAMIGQDVCGSHGGRTPASIRRAAERVALEKAGKLMVTYGERVEVDPGAEMLDLICWTAGHVRWLRARVQEIEEAVAAEVDPDDDETDTSAGLDGHPLIWGVTKRKFGGEDNGTTYEAKPNIWLAMYNTETDRLAKMCTDAVKIGLKQREIDLAERQGDMVMRVLDGVLAELGHNPSDPDTAAVVGRHLRAVA